MVTTLLRDEGAKVLRVGCSDGQNHDKVIVQLRRQHPGWTLELWRFERRSITRGRPTVRTTSSEQLDLEVNVTRWAADGTVTTRVETY